MVTFSFYEATLGKKRIKRQKRPLQWPLCPKGTVATCVVPAVLRSGGESRRSGERGRARACMEAVPPPLHLPPFRCMHAPADGPR